MKPPKMVIELESEKAIEMCRTIEVAARHLRALLETLQDIQVIIAAQAVKKGIVPDKEPESEKPG